MGRLALIASILGGAAFVPVVLSGQASAQSGSRICGRAWEIREPGNTGGEFIYKIYEVDKNSSYLTLTCATARDGGASEPDPTWGPDLIKNNLAYVKDGIAERDWTEFVIDNRECENFTNEVKNGKDIVFKDDGTSWSNPNQDDICNTMNKSENLGEMKAYWLMFNSNTKNWVWIFHG